MTSAIKEVACVVGFVLSALAFAGVILLAIVFTAPLFSILECKSYEYWQMEPEYSWQQDRCRELLNKS